jgi:hypothetical protein
MTIWWKSAVELPMIWEFTQGTVPKYGQIEKCENIWKKE